MEMATKVRLGKLTITGQLARNLEAAVAASGWRGLPLAINEAAAAGSLAWQQRDPFDRLLAAQAIHNELVLLTPDPAFTALAELRTLW
jgi:PIN domain nuclease of toxin-antitoxin system